MRALLVVNPSAGHRTAGPDDLEHAVRVIRDAGSEVECVDDGPRSPRLGRPRTARGRRPLRRVHRAARHAEHGSWRRAVRRVWRWATHDTHRVTTTVDGKTHAHRVMQILVRMGRFMLLRSLVSLLRTRTLPQKPVRCPRNFCVAQAR